MVFFFSFQFCNQNRKTFLLLGLLIRGMPASLFQPPSLEAVFYQFSSFCFQVPGENEKQWKPALLVLTDKDLLIYDSMPRRKEAWLSPVHMHPLLATR